LPTDIAEITVGNITLDKIMTVAFIAILVIGVVKISSS
jgi:hypothetical protein